MQANGVIVLEQLWDRLRRVRSLSFVANSEAATGWDGIGIGTVEIREASEGVMTWHERGSWQPGGERDIRFTNIYRWMLSGELLRLEYLRFGEANPVHLLDLAQAGESEWRPTSPYLCREDCYSAVLLVGDEAVVLRWSIDGPRKRETIEYAYAERHAGGRKCEQC